LIAAPPDWIRTLRPLLDRAWLMREVGVDLAGVKPKRLSVEMQ
jgi:hypothetical protein